MLTKKNVNIDAWGRAEKPFDMAQCGECLTNHSQGLCKLPEHSAIGKAVQKLPRWNKCGTEQFIRHNFAALVRLRKRFDRFYAKA